MKRLDTYRGFWNTWRQTATYGNKRIKAELKTIYGKTLLCGDIGGGEGGRGGGGGELDRVLPAADRDRAVRRRAAAGRALHSSTFQLDVSHFLWDELAVVSGCGFSDKTPQEVLRLS